jgi:flagellar protein FliS
VTTNPARLRYLADAISTATPAQRIVMLYDRLTLDIERAAVAADEGVTSPHARHAQQIVAELLSSLDGSTWSGAPDLAGIYGFVLSELIGASSAPNAARLRAAGKIVAELRTSWFEAGQKLNGDSGPGQPRVSTSAAGAWMG